VEISISPAAAEFIHDEFRGRVYVYEVPFGAFGKLETTGEAPDIRSFNRLDVESIRVFVAEEVVPQAGNDVLALKLGPLPKRHLIAFWTHRAGWSDVIGGSIASIGG
jgi:hypothetical protein